LAAKEEAERNYEREFTNFVRRMHKKKRDASRDSGGSLDTNIPKESKKLLKKQVSPRIRLASHEKAIDVKLEVAGMTIDTNNKDEDKGSKGPIKKKRVIIGQIKKGSVAASSPEGQKKISRSGVRSSGPGTGSANVKNRRLRSQDNANKEASNTTLNSKQLKPNLSTA
jgi:hypothetical protein